MKRVDLNGTMSLKVFSDSYVVEESEDGKRLSLVYGSFLGIKSHIEAAVNEVRGGGFDTLLEMPNECGVFKPILKSSLPFRSWMVRTAGDKFHGIYLLQDAMFNHPAPTGFYLIGNNERECKDRFFKYLSQYPVPLHPLWKDKLWSIFTKEDWIKPLEGYNKTGFKVYFEEDDCLILISEMIKKRKLTIPEEYWKSETGKAKEAA